MIAKMKAGPVSGAKQDKALATKAPKLKKEDGIIDWHQPANIIERKIRAFADWPQSRTQINDIDIIITKAHIVAANGSPGKHLIENDQLIVYATENALSVDTLKPAGKKEMPIQAFLAGYSSKL